MSKRRKWIFAALVLVVLLAFCAFPATTRAEVFQTQLDKAGVPYQVPAVGKAILVNIPSFELVAFDKGIPVLRSRIIVGAPWHRTPRLNTYVSSVRFRPTWRPPPSMIASGEYANRVWPAGPNNPLGLAAVRLQPGLLVYLHDTNNREKFDQEYRALSHGCVRVQQWDRLVAFVLGMDIAEVHRLANGRRTFDAPAPPIPVGLASFTRFPNAAGQIVDHPDIYGLGRAMNTALPDAATCEVADLAD
ncbi:L,D-transpeptidase family protein [Pseudosulfitobacter sp. SM2401]|uniref:L,D-transpeptidase family protein n=1 Tax=Pseudosulfitobacter sp. SM2401 TaxID=3350098 RepID=UPI0036F2B8FF